MMAHMLPALALAAAMTCEAAPDGTLPLGCEPETPITEEPYSGPSRIWLGVDCDEPFTVSLPDDVLTECEDDR